MIIIIVFHDSIIIEEFFLSQKKNIDSFLSISPLYTVLLFLYHNQFRAKLFCLFFKNFNFQFHFFLNLHLLHSNISISYFLYPLCVCVCLFTSLSLSLLSDIIFTFFFLFQIFLSIIIIDLNMRKKTSPQFNNSFFFHHLFIHIFH